MDLPHLPALRLGRAYESLEKTDVRDHRSGEPWRRVSQVNAGIIRRDLVRLEASRAALKKFTCAQLIEMCAQAAEVFANGTLPLGDKGHTQSPQQYVETLSCTSGLPYTLVRRNMNRISTVLSQMGTILRGLTRGLDLGILDNGFGEQGGSRRKLFRDDQLTRRHHAEQLAGGELALAAGDCAQGTGGAEARPRGAVYALAADPVVSRGGRAWRKRLVFTPPTTKGLARSCGSVDARSFSATRRPPMRYAGDPRIEIHGPGYSKILIGPDEIERWPEYLDLMVESIAQNGGRSCLNASAIIVPAHADEIADGLAKRLGPCGAAPDRRRERRACGICEPERWPNLSTRRSTTASQTPGAEEVTAKYRKGPRLVTLNGAVYLRPTIVRCDSFAHPLAIREYLFPYASVLEVPQAKIVESIGPSLVVTAITSDERLIEQLMESPHIDRLNIGPLSTMQVSWDQPHEGNLFELLYKRRAIQRV